MVYVRREAPHGPVYLSIELPLWFSRPHHTLPCPGGSSSGPPLSMHHHWAPYKCGKPSYLFGHMLTLKEPDSVGEIHIFYYHFVHVHHHHHHAHLYMHGFSIVLHPWAKRHDGTLP